LDFTRVHFVGNNDMALPGELKKSINILNSIDRIIDINDAIERYIIDKYLSDKSYRQFFIENLNYPINTVRKNNKKIINKYFNKMSGEDFLETSATVDAAYTSEYLEIFISYKTYQEIRPEKLKNLLNNSNFYLSDLLEQKIIVNYFDRELKDILLKETDTVELLIRHESNQSLKTIYTPQSLSHEDINSMVKKYIESSDPNTNILENIYRMKSDRLRLNDEIKFLAKNKYDNKIEEMFQKKLHSVIKTEYSVGLSDELNIDNPIEFTMENKKIKYIFNKEFLENNLQLDEIIGVVTYFLLLTDDRYRVVGLNNKSKISAIERVFSNINGSSYNEGTGSKSLNSLVNLIVMFYVNFLKQNSVSIEDAIGYFFNEYLEEKFSVKNYMFNIPTENTDLKEKIKLLATELDSIVKQYDLMDDERVINQEFVNFKTNVPKYKEIRSRVPIKYIYFNSKIAKSSISMLLNDQSLLYYYDFKNYKTLESVILNGKAYLSEMRELQQEMLIDLVNEGFFTIESDKVRFKNYHRYSLYKDLYLNDFVSYYNLPKIYQEIIDEDLVKGYLNKDRQLLSSQEADLFDYYLTSKFSDSLEIRNKYIHGSTEINAEVLSKDYSVLIRMILTLMIKIDDDLCIEESLKLKIR